MNIKRMACWFRVLCIIDFLIWNGIVNAEPISPGGIFSTSTYSVFPSSSITVPPIQDYCELGKDNCDPQYGNCISTGDTTFNCTCDSGFTGDGIGQLGCIDIDECKEDSTCVDTASCYNNQGGYLCICKSGYENLPTCSDIDECSGVVNPCDNATSICVNNLGSYYCNCRNDSNANYEKSSTGKCIDVDECKTNSCGESVCTNTDGSYTCGCNDGYTFDMANLRCDDIDECTNTSLYNCMELMKCNNTIGSYVCVPDDGYKYAPAHYSYSIIDINECLEGLSDCHQFATCENVLGSFECDCNVGYSGNGTWCEDVDECGSVNECDPNANCNNTDGSYICYCKDGFTGTGRGYGSCIDINECSSSPSPCPNTATCQNKDGSYICNCLTGYENSPTCSDIKECLGTNDCHSNAICANSIGSYSCSCKEGFTGSGTTCEDLDECYQGGFCANNANCNNTIGNYSCACADGYAGDGMTCIDVNECETSPCDQTCTNAEGSYTCSCDNGYTFTSPHTCTDTDECQTAGICQLNSECYNTRGSYECRCSAGYLESDDKTEDGITSNICVVDNFAAYSECPYIQNRDKDEPDRLIQISEGIPFNGVLQYDFYVCINGMISVQFDLCHSHPNGNLGDTMINGTLFAAFFTDIDLTIPSSINSTLRNRMYSCKYTHIEPEVGVKESTLSQANRQIQAYVRETTNFTDYVPRNSIVATWYEVVPYLSVTGSDYFNQGERATFQTVITSDGSNTVVYYIYHNMNWSDNKGFTVMVGTRYNPSESLLPSPPLWYNRLRFDKASFVNPNGIVTKGSVSFQVSDHVKTQAVKLCDLWYDRQPSKEAIAELYDDATSELSELILLNRQQSSCPCTISQVLVDFSFKLEVEFDPSYLGYIDKCHRLWEGPAMDCDLLSDQISLCFVKRTPHSPDSYFNFNYSVDARCCYKTKMGSLDTSRSESGTGLNTQNHFIPPGMNISTILNQDIEAHRYCCLRTALCSRYEERTRVPNCNFYSPPRRSVTFGDPHILSLDGTQYTFNGLGDYWLLTTNDSKINLDIQARTCQALNADGSKSPATVFCGFAFKEKGQPTFEIYHNSTETEPFYYVNRVKKPAASGTEDGTDVIYTTSPKKSLKFVFPSGTVLDIIVDDLMLQSEVMASILIQGKTVGLLGNVNGIGNDDLINRFTRNFIPASSNEETIYNDFGQSWKVSNDETLFSMEHVANLSNGYKPLFWTNVSHMMNHNQSLINMTRTFCGSEDTNRECYFDFAVTGNEQLASSGKELVDTNKAITTAVGREVPKINGPLQINVTRNVPMNFTIDASSNSTNLTYFIITNFTDSFTLLDAKTGLVNINPQTNNETVTIGAIDEFANAGVLKVKIIICDCVFGHCVYDVPEILGNLGNVHNTITQCACDPGYTGYRCESFIDSCLLDPCFINVTCYMFENRTSYCDPCPQGFSGDGRKCHDIDDCNPINPCEHNCINTVGSYGCACRDGYEKDGFHNCTDIDECHTNGTACDHQNNTYCNNTEGSHECLCKSGYRRNSTTLHCEDVNECAERSDGCQHSCHNTEGSYKCSCNLGTTVNVDNHTCDDNNECAQANDCDPNAKCTNTFGSYLCECKFGYSGNETYCADVDECDATVRREIGLTTSCEVNCKNLDGTYKCSCKTFQQLSTDNHTCFQKLNPCIQPGARHCDEHATCAFNMNTDEITCTCSPGYIGNGNVCTDKDECDTPNICGNFSICNNTLGSYLCSCQSGYTRSLDKTTCDDTNECVLGTANCPEGSTCRNTLGSFDCICNKGLTKVNGTCIDIDECITQNGGCKQVCNNKFGGTVECSCYAGFSINKADSRHCDDVNECTLRDPCHSDANCVNTFGSFRCSCKNGYSGNGTHCSDDNECITGHECAQNCTNNIGSFVCSCRKGYRLNTDKATCSNINECRMGMSNCDLANTECVDKPGYYICREKCPGLCNQNCTDTVDGYKCACRSGYKLSGKYNCRDINECDVNNTCHSSANCTNFNGTYSCKCQTGFQGDGKSPCTDINECDNNSGGCHANATCNNTIGNFVCKCNDGFGGDGNSCVDKNECSNNNGGCHDNANCVNTIGARTCTCKDGFTGNGLNCTDINECNTNRGGCHANATCTNTIGSYECKCKSGFDRDGADCVDRNECITSGHNCHDNATCVNNHGGHTCKCKVGFVGDGESSCSNENECQSSKYVNGGCHGNASCTDTFGSRICTCKDGFQGDGVNCQDINKCLVNNGNCHIWSTCTNTDGGEFCACKDGFEGDGTICYQILENDTTTIPPESPANIIRNVDASVILYEVKIAGEIVDVKINQAALRNISSSISRKLIKLLEPVLLTYYVLLNKRVFTVRIYNFVPLGADIVKRDVNSGEPSIKVEYAVGFNVNQTTSTEELSVLLTEQVNKTDYQINTRSIFAKIVPSGIMVQEVNPCTSTVDVLKHKCHSNAICTATAISYTCRCRIDYEGDGFTCKLGDKDTTFLVAIIAAPVGLLLLIILLIVFLVVRKRRRDILEINSMSSTSDVSWTPGVFGGMRARSMYTPAGVQPRQCSEYPTDDR